MPTTEVLEQRLTEAEEALHQLNLGAQVVKVGYDGESIEYRQTSKAQLEGYVARLEAQLGRTPTGQRGSIRPRFA